MATDIDVARVVAVSGFDYTIDVARVSAVAATNTGIDVARITVTSIATPNAAYLWDGTTLQPAELRWWDGATLHTATGEISH